MKKCIFAGCNEPHYAKKYCRKHYRQAKEESRTRWDIIKNDPILYEHRRKLQRAWEKTRKRDYKAHSDKIYFGGLREIAILRDGEKCVECGMTRKEHIAKWGKDLHVNHKDHTKVNSLENLETLCIRCHAKKSHYKSNPKSFQNG